MTELIQIKTQDGRQVVSAKELYDFLGYDKSQWSRWYSTNIIKDTFFVEHVDYQAIDIVSNGNPTKDFALTLNMAKELSMLARTEKGKQARQYFIECEKKALNPYANISKLDALRLAVEAEEKAERLQLEIETKHKPRSEFVDQVFNSDSLIAMSQVAKILGLPFGRNTLYKKLREKGVLFKNTNEPKQVYVNKGYFKLKENTFADADGNIKVSMQTFTTQKGLGYIAKLFQVITLPVNYSTKPQITA